MLLGRRLIFLISDLLNKFGWACISTNNFLNKIVFIVDIKKVKKISNKGLLDLLPFIKIFLVLFNL